MVVGERMRRRINYWSWGIRIVMEMRRWRFRGLEKWRRRIGEMDFRRSGLSEMWRRISERAHWRSTRSIDACACAKAAHVLAACLS